jgi:hypothetical protein
VSIVAALRNARRGMPACSTISPANRTSLEAAWMASRQLAGRSATSAADQRRALKQLQLMETKKSRRLGWQAASE